MLVLELIPAALAAARDARGDRWRRSASAPAPTCSGQVLVLHDMLDVYPGRKPRFVRNFMQGAARHRHARSRPTCARSRTAASRRRSTVTDAGRALQSAASASCTARRPSDESRSHDRRSARPVARPESHRVRADHGQSARGSSVVDGDGAPARRSGRRIDLRQSAAVRTRTRTSTSIRARCRTTSTSCRSRTTSTCCSRRTSRRCIRSRRTTACSPPHDLGDILEGEFRPGILRRRHHRGAEAVLLRAAARGGVRQEGLSAADDRAQHVPAVRAADRDHSARNRARRRRTGAVVAQPLSLSEAERKEAPRLYAHAE